MRRIITVTLVIDLIDPRTEEEREDTMQMIDAIAFGIDLDFRNEKSAEYEQGLRLNTPTQIAKIEEVEE